MAFPLPTEITCTLQLHFASYFGNKTLSKPELSVLVVVAILMSRAAAGLIAPSVKAASANSNANIFFMDNLLESKNSCGLQGSTHAGKVAAVNTQVTAKSIEIGRNIEISLIFC